MRNILFATVAATLLASSAGAVSFVGAFGAPDPGKAANQTYVVTFDAPIAAGYSWTGGIQTTNTTSGSAAAPAGTTAGEFYGYVSSAVNLNSATLLTPNLKSISFYWGSMDTYNFLDVLGAGGVTLASISGTLPSGNGDQSSSNTNRRLFITAGAGEVITGLTFHSTGVAFEFDSIAAGAVPEPATWAMLITGFGLVGFAARRRRSMVAIAA